jgi:hypothetical protein
MTHDLVIVGGGLAGVSLGMCILERTEQFRKGAVGSGELWGHRGAVGSGLAFCPINTRNQSAYVGTRQPRLASDATHGQGALRGRAVKGTLLILRSSPARKTTMSLVGKRQGLTPSYARRT